MKSIRTELASLLRPTVAVATLTLLTQFAFAATDVAQVPLFTSAPSTVKPNIMFVLDDSGSMSSDYMPDDANFSATGKYGKLSSQCNGLAYNPKTTYSLPVDANGNNLAAGSGAFNGADPTTLSPNYVVTDANLSIASSGDVGPLTVGTTAGWSVGDQVTIYNNADHVQFMTGTVKTYASGKVTISLNGSIGSGALLVNRAATGQPTLPYYYKYGGAETAMSYKYTSAGVDKTTTHYKECNSNVGSTPGSSVFTRVNMSGASADAQNYNNWYTYYRTRITMMKAAMSIAFKPLTDKYRVGFTSISSNTAAPGTKFLDIKTFDATQKTSFYTALNAASPGGNTPLRGALSKAGRYFANKAPGQTSDPIQYSCQKNFTILSTDGYWNTGAENSTYGAFDVNGAAVGQQDDKEDRPMRDGTTIATTTVTKWDSTETIVRQTDTTTTAYSNATKTDTSVYTPTTGSLKKTYTIGTKYNTINNSTIARSCTQNLLTLKWSCTVTVTTASAHGYTNGVSVVNTAASPFGGTFVISNASGSTYQYTISNLSSQPTAPTTAATRGTSFYSPVGCAAGQGMVTQTSTQTDSFSRLITSITNATATDTIAHTQAKSVIVTPYTQTVVVTNGTQSSDSGPVAGTPTTTNSALPSLPSDVGAGYSYTSPTTTTGPTTATPSGYTPVVTTNAAFGCATAAPATTTTTVAPVATTVTQTATSNPTLASVVAPGVVTVVSDVTVEGTKTPTTTTATTGASTNSLADIAEYYFKTDLRNVSFSNCQGALGSGTDVCGTTSSNPVQNMITFTIGLGTNGTLTYDPNYKKQKSGDFFDLTQGTKNWPIPTLSSNGGDPTNIDDLWHAAVNGRGQYFSAGDPSEVVKSLSAALLEITVITGSSSAAATSTLQPVAGDNDVFVAEFTSGKWIGDVVKYAIDPTTGVIDMKPQWSAATELDARVKAGVTARKIYYFKPGTGNTGALRAFNYANLTSDSKNSLFDGFCSKTGAGGSAAPQQCADLVGTDLTNANSGSNLVSYLTGTEFTTIYRARESALGDIVNASPVFVGTPKFRYTENAYATYATTQAANFKSTNNTGVVYVAANDGMLHAFDRATGAEKWAYIPSAVMSNMYKLADTAYAANHQFFVDGSPQSGDIYVGGAWKTILVGGLNAGGSGYYALDITDPDNPKALWEFKDDKLGLSFGNPIITKRADGTWVVVFASGYNNTSGTGDGNGYLFVLNASTGAQMTDVSPMPTYTTGTTAAGSVSNPSGLAKINAWVDSDIDNTTKVFYGGDLLGNVWRFDLDNQAKPFKSAYRLAQLIDTTKPQPITTKPQLAEVSYGGTKIKVVYVGTGRYLGSGDLSNTDLQTVYALKDTWTDASALGDVAASGTLIEQKLSSSLDPSNNPIRLAETNAVDWTTKNGWFVKLSLSSGERVNVNMSLALNVLSVATNVPTTSACDVGGQSWLYKFDIATGSAISNANDNAVGISLGNVLVAGQTVVQLADGQTVTISTLSNAKLRTDNQPPPPAAGLLRRTSWRELAN